ncbi:MAG TPA: hypothetical protein VM529_03100 [Gemmata sp.]|nr:hypothetical protein [Gemmata sp.]
MKFRSRTLVLALLFVLLLAGPAAAADGPAAAPFASYWDAFLDYWKAVFAKQNGIVMAVLGLGAVALFIITRGKWQK